MVAAVVAAGLVWVAIVGVVTVVLGAPAVPIGIAVMAMWAGWLRGGG